METISDKELDRIGMLQKPDNAKSLYEIDESLLYMRPRLDKVEIESRSKL